MVTGSVIMRRMVGKKKTPKINNVDGGYGLAKNLTIEWYLSQLTKDEKDRYLEKLKKEDKQKYDEFIEWFELVDMKI